MIARLCMVVVLLRKQSQFCLRLQHCKQTHMTPSPFRLQKSPFRLQKQNKDFQILNNQAIKMVNDSILPSLIAGPTNPSKFYA